MTKKGSFGSGKRIKNRKQLGEWAELCFMARAAGEGMCVLKPYGDSMPYDVAVGNTRVRVQVKCTTYHRGNRYSVNMTGSNDRRYSPGTLDFFAIFVIPIEEWYIIPYKVVGQIPTLQFTPGSKRTEWIRYREAWHLLGILEIQACVESLYAEEPATEQSL